jgi:heme-degrading monooxygenase HmoA
MATMLIQLKVKDFADWKKVFDSGDIMRKSNGEISHQVYQDAGDPNELTTVFKWNSLANAQKFAQSTELRTAMADAGVQGPPHVHFLKEA